MVEALGFFVDERLDQALEKSPGENGVYAKQRYGKVLDLPEYMSGDFKTSFNDVDYIGSGSFGAVRRCYHGKLGEVAVKCVTLTGTTEDMMSSWDSVRREAEVLKRLKHPNIVEVLGVVKWSSNIGLILEYVGGKNLEKIITDQQILLPRSTRLKLIHQLSSAIKYLHTYPRKKFTHGDIKASNILITPQFHLKLADFGAANVKAATGCQSSSLTLEISTVHTLMYSAPEILRGEGYDETPKDVYSFAVVAYEIAIKTLASIGSHEMNQQDLIDAITGGQRPNVDQIGNDDPIKPLIVSCWSQSKHDRPNITEVEKLILDIEKEVCDEMEADGPGAFKITEPSLVSDRRGLNQFLPPYKRC